MTEKRQVPSLSSTLVVHTTLGSMFVYKFFIRVLVLNLGCDYKWMK